MGLSVLHLGEYCLEVADQRARCRSTTLRLYQQLKIELGFAKLPSNIHEAAATIMKQLPATTRIRKNPNPIIGKSTPRLERLVQIPHRIQREVTARPIDESGTRF
jgi:hypothetical protein